MVRASSRGPGLAGAAATVQGLERQGCLYKVTDVTMPMVRTRMLPSDCHRHLRTASSSYLSQRYSRREDL